MRPLTRSRPKVMLPVGGIPLLEEILTRAKSAGVDDFVLVVGYCQEAVRAHFGDGSAFGFRIRYAYQEEQRGTGHALAVSEDLAQQRFLVLNGDILPDLAALREMAKAGEPAVSAFRVADPCRYGVFLIRDGMLESVVEKCDDPPTDLANAGIYLLDRRIFGALQSVPLSSRGEYELTDALNALVRAGARMKVQELQEWIEVGRPWDILTASASVLACRSFEVDGVVEAGAYLGGQVHVGSGTVVRSGSYIEGPVWIGRDCDIGPNCYIRSGTCLGDRVRVGNAVEVKNSTVMDGTKIGHLSYIGDSVIGSGCNFGAGTIVSNLRHDDRPVPSFVKGERVDSGRRKLGVIMGDDVKTGIHTTIYPGTVIEAGFRSRPGEVLRGYLRSPQL